MVSYDRTNSGKIKGKIGKSKRNNSDRGEKNAGNFQNHEKEVNTSKSDDPLKITEEVLPPCQVILTRCDGWTSSPGCSSVAVKTDGNNGEGDDDSGGKCLARRDKSESESGLAGSKIHKTNSGQLVRKPPMDCPVSTHVGVRQHKCELCSTLFERHRYLEVHIRTHTGERPYKCQICLQSFVQKGDLNKHTRIHTGERPHQCQRCSKSFTEIGNLKKHMRIHTGERPHQCQLCSKSFAVKGNLSKHMRRVHTGERLHNCELCTKKFNEKGDLIRHVRTHTGERPHQCQLCSKSFAQGGALKMHIRTHTTPLNINICGLNQLKQ